MKAFLIIFNIFFSTNIVVAQRDTIHFQLEKDKYKQVAQERLRTLYSRKDKQDAPIFTPIKTNKYASPLMRHSLNQIETISIPILGWSRQSYKCGDNIETLITFKQDFLFQEVIIVTKDDNIKVGMFDIYDSYNEGNRKKDSVNNVQFSLHGRPVMSDTDKVEKRLHKFIKKNPNAFVFMIRGLHGYWAVIEGKFVKLLSKRCKIRGEPGSEFICKQYGEEFVNDAITNNFRTGGVYTTCNDCKINEPIRINIEN